MWPRPTNKIESLEHKNHRLTKRSNCQNIDYSIENGEIGDRSNKHSQIEKYKIYKFIN